MKKQKNGLIRILNGFNGGQMTEKKLDTEFAKLARRLFFEGHFLVEGRRHIYLEQIEFYYHEEGENGIKDPVMYHTNDHEKRELHYFKVGHFNMHQSGVDVTFENPDKNKQYRASFLIRAYSVIDPGKPKRYEKRSTFIYEDMFYMGVPMDETIDIKWVDNDDESSNWDSQGEWRQNVADYEKDENGKYIKKNKEGEKDDSNGNYNKAKAKEGDEYFFSSGKRYRKCPRKWRFIKNKKISQ